MDNRPKLPPPPVPKSIGDGLTLLAPITRNGFGPGLIILVNEESRGLYIDKKGVPSPLQKWGEEGYTVVEASTVGPTTFCKALDAIKAHEKYQPAAGIGVVAYDDNLWANAAPYLSQHTEVISAVVYTSSSRLASHTPTAGSIPLLVHIAGEAPGRPIRSSARTEYYYPDQADLFASPSTKNFHYAQEAVSHTRNLTHLKKAMDGPLFDLEVLWDEHTYYEFEARDVEATMCTMVQEPYVNHIPTLTGGIGREELTVFYRDHFIFSNPADTALELISRTVGIDRVVDEFLFKFTHDKVVDWLFPGIPATDKYVEIPFMAVVNIRGDRLYHEHITWDHASALRQIGWLPETLPYVAEKSLTNGVETNGAETHNIKKTGNHILLHQSAQSLVLPVAGIDTARKLRDKNAVRSNLMFREAGVRSI